MRAMEPRIMTTEERRQGEACAKCGSGTKPLVDGTFCSACRWDLVESIKQQCTLIGLYRVEDESGVSGEGLVAVGIMWPDGGVVIQWLNHVNPALETGRNGWAMYPGEDGLADAMEVHGHGDRTKLIMLTDSSKLASS